MDASRHLKRVLGKKTILEQILKKKTLSGNISMDSKDMNYNHKLKYKTKHFGNLQYLYRLVLLRGWADSSC